jgi:hypothetical protein
MPLANYLADAVIAPVVMLRGEALLEDPAVLGIATETRVQASEQSHECRYHGARAFAVSSLL